MIFDLNDKEHLHKDLVARVLRANEEGAVTHDIDVTYLIRHNEGFFARRDVVREEEVVRYLEKEGEECGTKVYFVRWEEPGEWDML